MKIGFIGVGKLGKDAAEVMAEKHNVIGYDVTKVEPENFNIDLIKKCLVEYNKEINVT